MQTRDSQRRAFRRLVVGLALGFLLIAWGMARWMPFTREPEDTAPLDIRGQPINAGLATNTAPSGSQPSRATNATQLAAVVRGAAAREGGSGGVAAETPATPEGEGAPPGDPTSVAPRGPDGHVVVTFEQLAGFTYEMPDQPLPAGAGAETLVGRIPPRIRALDRQSVAVKGFMLPMKLEDGRATELLLMRDQSMCCFGVVPKINEWLNVKMARGVKPVMDQPVTISGTLRVGEAIENGYLVSIYALDGERLATALDE